MTGSERHPFLAIGTTVMGLSVLGMVWIESVTLLILSQATLGLGLIVNIVASQAMVGNRTSRARRDQRYGLYAVAASLGQLIGPAAAALIAGRTADADGGAVGLSVVPVFGLAAAATVPALILAGSLLMGAPRRSVADARPQRGGTLASASEVLRIPTMLPAILVSVSVILSVDLLLAYLPVYGEERGLPVELIGALLSLRAASAMASRLAMGRLIAGFGRGRLLVGSTALAGASLAAFPLVYEAWALVILSILVGIGLGFGQPMTIAWVASQSPRALRATALGVRLTGNRLGQLTAPLFVGVAAGVAGVAAVFWSLSMILGAASLLILRTPLDRTPGSARQHDHRQ